MLRCPPTLVCYLSFPGHILQKSHCSRTTEADGKAPSSLVPGTPLLARPLPGRTWTHLGCDGEAQPALISQEEQPE